VGPRGCVNVLVKGNYRSPYRKSNLCRPPRSSPGNRVQNKLKRISKQTAFYLLFTWPF